MLIANDRLKIRSAKKADVNYLLSWWNSGEIMAHAGFPLGLNTTESEILKKIEDNTANQILILEEGSNIIGEMNYKVIEPKTADIGIKICNKSFQNMGLGTKLIKMLINELFNKQGFNKLVLSTNLNNYRAQHVYEKIGFNNKKVFINSWKDQVGVEQSHVEYELFKNQFIG